MNNIQIHIMKNNRGHVELVLVPFKDETKTKVESFKVRIEVREYGEGGRGTAKDHKGQMKKVQYFLSISEALLLAEQIGTFNLKFWDKYTMKDPLDNSKQLSLPSMEKFAGIKRGRKLQIQLSQLKSGTRFKFKVTEGEAERTSSGGTKIKAGTEVSAENYQTINDTMEAFLSLKMFLQALANAEMSQKTFRIWKEIEFVKEDQAETPKNENKSNFANETTKAQQEIQAPIQQQEIHPQKDEEQEDFFKNFDFSAFEN